MLFQQTWNINKDTEFIYKNQTETKQLKSTMTELLKAY